MCEATLCHRIGDTSVDDVMQRLDAPIRQGFYAKHQARRRGGSHQISAEFMYRTNMVAKKYINNGRRLCTVRWVPVRV